MDRRFFLHSVLATAGAAATMSLLPGSARATTLFDEVKDLDNTNTSPADLPAEGATETQWGRRRCVWRRNRWGRPVRVCRRGPWRRRRRRRCFWRRNRWGRRIRVCRWY